jgi:hypothetical protein
MHAFYFIYNLFLIKWFILPVVIQIQNTSYEIYCLTPPYKDHQHKIKGYLYIA